MKNPEILSIYCVFEIYWKHYPRKKHIEIYDSLCREIANIISTQTSTIGKKTSSRASSITYTIPKQTSTKTSITVEKTSSRTSTNSRNTSSITYTIPKQTYTQTSTPVENTSSRAFSRTSTITKQTSTKTYTINKQNYSFENKKIKSFQKTQLTNKVEGIPSTGKNNNDNTQGLGVGQ